MNLQLYITLIGRRSTNIVRIVWQTVRRITTEILSVKGLLYYKLLKENSFSRQGVTYSKI